jgi:flagellar biosynthesis anti-sigma factor FlgM
LLISFPPQLFSAARKVLNRGAMKNGAGGKRMSRPTGNEDYVLQILQILEELPDVRQDKVEKLRIQIEQGRYKVDAGRIADRMIEEAIKDILYRTGKNLN